MHVKIKKHFLKIFISVFAVVSTFIFKGFWNESSNLKNIADGSKSLFKDISSSLIYVDVAKADTTSTGGDTCGCTSGCGSSDADGCGCSSGTGGNADGGSDGSSGDGGGSGSCAGCFTYKQKVLTLNGSVEIGKLRVGDKVVSYDEKLSEFTTSIIERIIIHNGIESPWHDFSENPLIELSVEIAGQLFSTEVTQNHRYYDITNDLYKTIAEFNIGDKLKGYTGEGVIRDKKILINENDPQENKNTIVYNLHMKSDPHNYLVNGIVVHNIK